MKNLPYSLLIILFAGFTFAQEDSATLVKKVEGFSHPESVVFDAENNVMYVSNIGDKEPGDGFISKISPTGEILELNWITGLNDPKGLLLMEDQLFVTDKTEFVEMDPQTGEVTRRIAVEGAESLNDITSGNNGTIYISDMGKSSIYKREPSGEITEWMNSEDLNSPNGLLVEGDIIYVAAWGEEVDGNILKVNLDSKEVEKITQKGIGNLDGIQRIEKDKFYFSDWATGKIYKIDTEGNLNEILTSEKSAGDILFFAERNQLVLPMNHQNAVWWYQIK